MIGRDAPVRPFELIRWARAQAKDLKPLEAHVLLVLATYADENAIAWPSIKTLALDCGLSPSKVIDKRTGQERWKNSSVSRALLGLQERQLIWTEQGGNGRTPRRELLFNPSAQPSAQPDRCPRPAAAQPSRAQDPQPSRTQDQNYQHERPTAERPTAERPENSRPENRTAVRPRTRTAGLRPLSVLAGITTEEAP